MFGSLEKDVREADVFMKQRTLQDKDVREFLGENFPTFRDSRDDYSDHVNAEITAMRIQEV